MAQLPVKQSVPNNTITNAHVNSAAAIAETKLDIDREGASTTIGATWRREIDLIGVPTEGCVAGIGDEFKVEQQAAADMTVRITATNAATTSAAYGADCHRWTGAGTQINSGTITADGTNPRYVLVAISSTGSVVDPSIALTHGTPAATPAVPALPANHKLCAIVRVGAGVTTLANAVIYDHRRRAGFTPNQETRTSSTAQTFTLAKRVRDDRLKLIHVTRNGLGPLTWVSPPTALDEYDATNGIPGSGPSANAAEANGTIVRFGAAPATTDVHTFSYLY